MAYTATINASTNPNYPSATAGYYYLITVAGRVGGKDGRTVNAGDVLTCAVTNSGGTEQSVGRNWTVTAATSATKLAADLALTTAPAVTSEALTVGALTATTATVTTATVTNATTTKLTMGATRVGIATVGAGDTSVVVATAAALSTSAILVTPMVSCAVTPCFVSDVTDGVSFKINGDPGDYAWAIIA